MTTKTKRRPATNGTEPTQADLNAEILALGEKFGGRIVIAARLRDGTVVDIMNFLSGDVMPTLAVVKDDANNNQSLSAA